MKPSINTSRCRFIFFASKINVKQNKHFRIFTWFLLPFISPLEFVIINFPANKKREKEKVRRQQVRVFQANEQRAPPSGGSRYDTPFTLRHSSSSIDGAVFATHTTKHQETVQTLWIMKHGCELMYKKQFWNVKLNKTTNKSIKWSG